MRNKQPNNPDNNENFFKHKNNHNTNQPQNDFSLNSFATSNKNKSNNPKSKNNKERLIWSRIGRIVLSVFLIGIITGSLVTGAFAIYVFGFVDDTIQEDLEDLKLDFTTTVYVMNKETEQYEEFQRLHGANNRIWVGINEIPEHLLHAYEAIEDKRFREHTGVDWKRTLGAFANMFVDLYSSNQGGSTITQQLVKNLTGDDSQSPMRKIREIMRARKLEEEYSKDIILECYLNTIALANGIYGVEVASNFYFDKKTSELTLVESAALAAMTKEPERYRPDKNPENNKKRRILVLSEMLDQGKISQAEYDEASKTDIKVVASKEKINEVKVNSYFVDTLIDDVIKALVEEFEHDKTYASKNFYNGGYKIYCTLDTDVQASLDEVYANDSHFNIKSRLNPDAMVQSSMSIMDYEGHVVAIIGGRGEKTTNRGLNRATDSPRQPGSTIKPISAYAQALEYNMITYSSLIDDKPITIREKGVNRSWPKNAYGGYRGMTTVQSALERSVNTIAVRVIQDLTPQKSFEFMRTKFGIHNLVESQKTDAGTISDINLSAMALGGCVYGLTSRELTAAFATFGNLGKFYEPTTFVKVTDQHDNVIFEQPKRPIVAISEDTASVMNHLLQTVITGSSGSGRTAKFGNMPIFGKTGTTSDTNDLWFVGGTPYYVASTWLGFDVPETLSGNSSSALRIWKAVMEKVHKELPVKDFQDSEFITKRRYCTSTGLVATINCPSTAIGWYKSNYLFSCTRHKGQIAGEVKDLPPSNNQSKPNENSSKNSSTTPSSSSQVPVSSEVSEESSSSKDDTTSSNTSQDTVTQSDPSSVD